jgi:hypothetical protein
MSRTRVIILTAALTVAMLAAVFGLAMELGEWFVFHAYHR